MLRVWNPPPVEVRSRSFLRIEAAKTNTCRNNRGSVPARLATHRASSFFDSFAVLLILPRNVFFEIPSEDQPLPRAEAAVVVDILRQRINVSASRFQDQRILLEPFLMGRERFIKQWL